MDELVPKKNTHLPVWTYVGLRRDHQENVETVICRLCRAVILARGGNTSNLFSHLKNHHAKEHASIEKQKKKGKSAEENSDSSGKHEQITLSEAVERSQPYTRSGRRWKEITESVTHYMAKEIIPVYTVEKPGFRKMMKKLDPRYELPSRKYFSKTVIPSLYSETRDRVTKELQEAEYYSVTTDLWSSSGNLNLTLQLQHTTSTRHGN